MLLGRRLDERMLKLQRQGRIGTFAPIKGQEASQIGSVSTLTPTDWMVPSFRETAALLWRGLADREDPALLRGLPRRGPAGAGSARSADHHPRRHPAPARRRARLRRPVQGRRRRRHGLLRRRRHVRGRLPRGAELRGRLARARRSSWCRTTSGRSPCRSRSRPTRARSPRRRWPTGSPAFRWTATTCSPSRWRPARPSSARAPAAAPRSSNASRIASASTPPRTIPPSTGPRRRSRPGSARTR